MARTNVFVSASKLRLITSAIPSNADRRMATCGVWKRGCTRASARKNRPSPAIAKNTRGAASMLPLTELNDEIITNSETRATPARPNRVCITSAATSGDRPMASTGRT